MQSEQNVESAEKLFKTAQFCLIVIVQENF